MDVRYRRFEMYIY